LRVGAALLGHWVVALGTRARPEPRREPAGSGVTPCIICRAREQAGRAHHGPDLFRRNATCGAKPVDAAAGSLRSPRGGTLRTPPSGFPPAYAYQALLPRRCNQPSPQDGGAPGSSFRRFGSFPARVHGLQLGGTRTRASGFCRARPKQWLPYTPAGAACRASPAQR
jgi:hypothetical protein